MSLFFDGYDCEKHRRFRLHNGHWHARQPVFHSNDGLFLSQERIVRPESGAESRHLLHAVRWRHDTDLSGRQGTAPARFALGTHAAWRDQRV